MMRNLTAALALATLLSACGAGQRAAQSPTLEPLPLANAPAPLANNYFRQDQIAGMSEAALKEILAAPVFLETGARVGVMPVASRYELTDDAPLTETLGTLSQGLTDSGHFEVVSEISTDWPNARNLAGLRELAARYRVEYLLLYRHRFIQDHRLNAWSLGYLTLVGALFVPANTVETKGVLEATLFDVKTGTILFTVFERTGDEQDSNIWGVDRKVERMQAKLLEKAAKGLVDQVLGKLNALAAARPALAPAAPAVAVSPGPQTLAETP